MRLFGSKRWWGGGVVLAGVMADCIVASSTRRVTKARLRIEVLAPSRLNSVPTRIPLPGKRVVTSPYLVTSSRTQVDPCIPGIDLSGAGHLLVRRPTGHRFVWLCQLDQKHIKVRRQQRAEATSPPQQLIEYPCSLDTIGQNLTGWSLLAAGDRWPGDAGDRQGVTPLVPLTAGCRRGHRDHRDTRPVQVTRWSLHATLSPIADTLAISASEKNAIFQSENHLWRGDAYITTAITTATAIATAIVAAFATAIITAIATVSPLSLPLPKPLLLHYHCYCHYHCHCHCHYHCHCDCHCNVTANASVIHTVIVIAIPLLLQRPLPL